MNFCTMSGDLLQRVPPRPSTILTVCFRSSSSGVPLHTVVSLSQLSSR